MHTLIAPAINLGILIAVLAFYLRQPIKDFVRVRAQTVAEDLRKAQNELRTAQTKYEEFTAKLKAVDAEVSAVRMQFRQDAQAAKVSIIAESKKLSQSIVADAKVAGDNLLADLKGQLYAELGGKVLNRAESIIRDRLTGDDRARIRREFSSQVETVQ